MKLKKWNEEKTKRNMRVTNLTKELPENERTEQNDDRTERSVVKERMKRGSEVVMKKFSEILLILF